MAYEAKGSRGDGVMFPPSGSAVPKIEEIDDEEELGPARPRRDDQDDLKVTGPKSSTLSRAEDAAEKVTLTYNASSPHRGSKGIAKMLIGVC